MIVQGKTLMERLIEAGYPKDEMILHDTDLWVYVTPISRRVVKQWCKDNRFDPNSAYTTVYGEKTGRAMYRLDFCNDEWWNREAPASSSA